MFESRYRRSLETSRTSDVGTASFRNSLGAAFVFLLRLGNMTGRGTGGWTFRSFKHRKDTAMSDAKVRGVVHLIEETKTYGQKGFRKRLVVLEQDNNRFANFIPLEFTREGCDTVDDLSVGDEVEISYQLSGRKWQKDASSEVRFFLNAEATGFARIGDGGGGEVPDDANRALAEAASEDEEVPF